jgi:hypothetical protein
MTDVIEWGPLQRATNARNQLVACRKFDIKSRDGFVSGTIVVKDNSLDAISILECKDRLAILLEDALYELHAR